MDYSSQYDLIVVLGFMAGIIAVGFILWWLFIRTPKKQKPSREEEMERAFNNKLDWTPEYHEEQKQKLAKMKKEMGINW
jgi:hypothetical protein